MNHCVPCYVGDGLIVPASFIVDGTSTCPSHVVSSLPAKRATARANPVKVNFVDGAPPKSRAKRKPPSSK